MRAFARIAAIAAAFACVGAGPDARALTAPDPGSISAQRLQLPAGPASIRGLADSPSANVFHAQLGYSIPIEVPSAAAGFAPKVSLDYSGALGNGPLGIGWQLSQVQIRRSLRRGVPGYTDADLLELTGLGEGERLVRLADGSFRVEGGGNRFWVERFGDGFRVHAPDGLVYFLGVTDEGRKSDGGRVASWLLQEIDDEAGQIIQFAYLKDQGELYPSQITWGPAKIFQVRFQYEARPDPSDSYRTGFLVRTQERLAQVQVWSHGEQLRALTLSYDPTATLSRIAKVRATGRGGAGSLPELSFGWGGAIAPSATAMQNTGGWVLNQHGVSVLDVDGDGLGDLLRLEPQAASWRRNLGGGRFGDPVAMSGAPGATLTQDVLLDVDGDARPELVRVVGSTWRVRQLDGNGWVLQPSPLAGSSGVPLGSAQVALVDINGDGATDVLEALTNGLRLRLGSAAGLGASVLLPPISALNATVQPGAPGVRFHDVNGDGIADAVWLKDDQMRLFLGRGDGTFVDAGAAAYPWSQAYVDLPNVFLADLNRDGLVDLLRFSAGNLSWYPGLPGLQFSTTAVSLPRPDAASYDAVVMVADLNGNGSEDVVWSSPAGLWALDLAGATSAGMLTRIDNGMGKVVTVEYDGSAALSARAAEAGQPWTTQLPISIPVPVRVTVSPGAEPDRVSEYEVRDGVWDGREREFAGFQLGRTRSVGAKPERTLVEEMHFLVGLGDDRPLRGKVASSQRMDGTGRVYESLLNTWDVRAAGGLTAPLARRAVLTETRTREHEGVTTPIESLVQVSFDAEARPIEEKHWGRLDRQGDEKIVQRTWASDDTTWVRDQVVEEKLLTWSGEVVSDTRHLFGDDHSLLPFGQIGKGWLRQTDALLAQASGSRWVTTVRKAYDVRGNVVEEYGSGVTRKLDYDADGLFVIAEHVEPESGRSLTWTAEFDAVLALPVKLTDANGVVQSLSYDLLGRISSVALGTSAPHVIYQYDWTAPRPKTITYTFEGPLSAVTALPASWDPSSNWKETVAVANGMGEPSYVATRLDNSRWIVSGASVRDERGRTVLHAQPFYWDGAVPDAVQPTGVAGETIVYDAMDRPVQVSLPTGAKRSTTFAAYQETVLTDGYAAVTSTLDGLDRVFHTERTVGGTRETVDGDYDAAGRLVAIRLQGGAASHTFAYDTLGRLVQADDPDIGHRELAYDDRNLLLTHTNGAGQKVTYEYDGVARVVRETLDGGKPIVYHYDLPKSAGSSANAQGRVAWIEEETGEVQLGYDELGRRQSTQRTVLGVSAEERLRYGAGGLVLGVDHDDGFSYDVEYDVAGRAIRYGSYWTATKLDAASRPLEETFGNATRQLTERDANGLSSRIQVLRPTGASLYDVFLKRSAYGAVTAVDDMDGVGLDHTARFDLDEGGRLTGASLGSGTNQFQFTYAYDGLQNMIRREAIGPKDIGLLAGEYKYAERGRGPRQLTSVVHAGGSVLVDYDAAGRVVQRGGASLSYNALDQLVAVSLPPAAGAAGDTSIAYKYGYDGLRTYASDSSGYTQTWFSSTTTERNGQREHYVLAGDRVLAKVVMNGDASGNGGWVDAARRLVPPALFWSTMLGFSLCGFFCLGALFLRPLRARRRRAWATLAIFAVLPGCSSTRVQAPHETLTWSAGTTTYFHQGFAAGPALMTRADGTVLEERRYEPFGQPIDAYSETPGGGSQIGLVDHEHEPRNVLNKETDARTGWSFHGARWMAPELAMWLSPDPPVKAPDPKFMLSPWDLHPYQYVRQNPLLYWDPDGNAPAWLHTVLDVGSFIPGVGVAVDLVHAGIYVSEGNYRDAALTAITAVPFGKVVKVGAKLAEKALVKAEAKIAEKLAVRAEREALKAAEREVVSAEKAAAGGFCFAAGTLVETADGPKPIEEVELGELVWSRDELTGETALRSVVQRFVTRDTPVLELRLQHDDGSEESLTVTPTHPIYVEGRGWVTAEELRAGDVLASATDRRSVVVGRTDLGQRRTVYNFEVAGLHTYFVGEGEVWVHNNNCDASSTLTRREAMSKAQQHAQVPRVSKGGEPIPFDELHGSSRGANAAELQRQGATNLGRRDPRTGAQVFDHPDGHPDLTGPGQPSHHAGPHVHGTNAAGEEIIIPYSGPSR
jgi:RHS repeat-associated protein